MVTYCTQTYHADHFEYTEKQSHLHCCELGTNSVVGQLQLKNKLTEKDQICRISEGRDGGLELGNGSQKV